MIHLSMQKNIVKKIASDVDNHAAFSEKRYYAVIVTLLINIMAYNNDTKMAGNLLLKK